ncbi:hypothetical protein EMPS_08640 [Entomortierella parvispora]|uniref:Polysaccharide lyase 14 domain-containing protein n=1 Tax=Entomortierella parvispora TaxID=205924 RepID=A0A9P3HGS1_9FUNG|nr:hypothetical protein EMPS_08640 [Entomortierella parvispora]
MHFLLSALLVSTLAAAVVSAPTPATNTTDGDVSISSLGSNILYHWEVSHLPTSVSQLQGPLHLAGSIDADSNFAIVSDPISKQSSNSDRVLRTLYPAHSYSGSKDKHSSFISTPLPKEAFSGPKSRFIRLEYLMLFQPGFEWIRGGKLPGILLGTEQGCNAGCSGGGSAERCFSTRMMWRPQGYGELYLHASKSVYFPREKVASCKRSLDRRSLEALLKLEQQRIDALHIPEYDDEPEQGLGLDESFQKRAINPEHEACLKGLRIKTSPGSLNMCNPNYGISIGRGGAFKFQSGKWHNVTQIVRVNSKGDAVRDGYLAVYLDSQPVIQVQDLILLRRGYDEVQDPASRQVKFMFSSFLGGHDKSYQTPKDQWIAWKGFKMSTSLENIWE